MAIEHVIEIKRPPAIQPPPPTTRHALVGIYGLCFECGEPRRPFTAWTLTAEGKPEMVHGLRCGCGL